MAFRSIAVSTSTSTNRSSPASTGPQVPHSRRSTFASLPAEFDRYPYIYLHSVSGSPTTFRSYSKGTYQLVQSVPLEHSLDQPSNYVGAVRENSGREYAFVENNYVYLMSKGSGTPAQTCVIKMSLTNFTWEKLKILTGDNTASPYDGYVVGDSIYFARSGAYNRPKIYQVRRNPLELVRSGGANVATNTPNGILVDQNFDRIYLLTYTYSPSYTRVSTFVLSTFAFVSHTTLAAGDWGVDPTPKSAFTKRGPYVYYLSRTSQTNGLGNGRIVKANYPTSQGGTFTLHSTIVLPNGKGECLCVDSSGTYGYVTSSSGTYGSAYIYVYKIRLSDLTIVQSYSRNEYGIGYPVSALDEANGLLYVLCYYVNKLFVFDLNLNLQGTYSVPWATSIFLVKE